MRSVAETITGWICDHPVIEFNTKRGRSNRLYMGKGFASELTEKLGNQAAPAV